MKANHTGSLERSNHFLCLTGLALPRHFAKASRQTLCIFITCVSLLLIHPYSFSQTLVTQEWVQTYNGPAGGPDGGTDIAVDSADNVIVAGSSRGSTSLLDFVLIKYSPSGDTLWVRRYNGSGNGDDRVRALKLDASGNIIVTGAGRNANGNFDFLTLKYDPSGILLWAKEYDGTANGYDEGRAIGIDPLGNICIGGISEGSGTGNDFAVVKYDANGNLLWAEHFDGAGMNDGLTALGTDGAGDVIVTGFIQDAIDTAKRDIVTLKYNGSGQLQWQSSFNGPFNGDDRATALAVDNNGFIYITGFIETASSGMNMVTIKYSSSGQQIWASEYNGPANEDDMGLAIATDNNGNCYVTGTNFTISYQFHDYVTIKYNSSGDTSWVRRYNGPANSNDIALDIALDDSGNVYVTGYNFVLVTHDYATVKYTDDGTEQWVIRYNGSLNGDDGATAIALDKNQNVYVTGIANSTFGLFYPGMGANSDVATVKYGQQVPPTMHTSIVCQNGEAQYWGWRYRPAASPVPAIVQDFNSGLTLTNVVAVSPGVEASMILLDDGTVWIFGSAGTLSQVNISCIKEISIGSGFYMMLRSDGTVWVYGYNNHGQFGNGTTSNVYQAVPQQVPNLPAIRSIAAGGDHALALSETGELYAWGYNAYGQVGNGTSGGNVTSAVLVLSGVSAITAGWSHSLALMTGGTVKSWGWNYNGQLGNSGICYGSSSCLSTTPVPVDGLTGIIDIAAGGEHSLALNSAGQIFAWGDNSYGQYGDGCVNSSGNVAIAGPNIPGAIDIISSPEAAHSWVILNNGEVKIWGDNIYCELGDNNCPNGSCSPVSPDAGSLCYAIPNRKPTGIVIPVTATAAPSCSTPPATGTATATPQGGTPPYNYQWSTTPTQNNSQATGLSPGTYTVTVTDANGCTGMATVVVTQYPVPPLDILGNNNDCTNPATYTVGSIGGGTVSWSVTNGTLSCTTCTATVVNWTIPVNGTGTLIATLTDVLGCQNSDTLTVFPCCEIYDYPPPVILNNATSPCGTTTTYNGQRIQINGTYLICNNSQVIFSDCLVYFGPDAKIVISPGGNLLCVSTGANINDPRTVLQAGCNIMWDGIYLNSFTSALSFTAASGNNPTIVMDAKNAVVAKNGGTYTIEKTAFFNDLKGIVQQNDANEVVKSTFFYSVTGTLKPYYLWNTIHTAPRTFICGELTDVNSITIGATGLNNLNWFYNADYGINSKNSTVTLINNKFQNITQTGGMGGIAVLSTSVPAGNIALIVGGSTATKNTFQNCYAGVAAFGQQNLTANNNELTNVQYGISAIWFSNSPKTINILSNTLTNYINGIYCLEVPQCTLKVNNNNLVQNNVNYATGRGITVWNAQTGPASLTPEIKNNVISGSAGSFIDISAVNVRNGYIKSNTITKPHSNSIITAVYGIRIEGSTNPKVASNTVQRSTATDPNSVVSQLLYGISVESSAGSMVAKNTLIRMGSGIKGKDACTNSKFYCNTLNKCYNGFFFENATIGNQGNQAVMGNPGVIGLTTDNVWTDLTGQPNSKRIRYALASSINWYYKSGNSNLNPTSGVGTTDLSGGANPISFQATSGISGCNIFLPAAPPFTTEEREAMFGPIVRNERQFNNHQNEFRFAEIEFAFSALKEDSLLNLGAPDDALFQNFIDSVQMTNIGKVDIVRKAVAENDLVLAESINSAITPAHLIEENRKTVNNIYIKAAIENRTEWDANETAILEGIACQNPLEGGDAVYSARVMLRKDTLCQPSAKMGFVNKEEKYDENNNAMNEVQNFSIGKIYPNPNDGTMQLDYTLVNGQNGKMVIYDILGQDIKAYSLLNENTSIKISEGALKNGIYFYKIMIDNKTVFNDKIIIIR